MRQRGRSSAPLVPERIGRYEVLLPIASGGMGTVYLARSSGVGGFQREVALKVMHAHLREEEHFATDLIEEAKLAARIQHPNVVVVIDVGEDPHGVFLVMEYIEGESLAGLKRAARKRDETMPVRIAIRVLADALLGLHAAHELRDEAGELLGLVHRDFSPQNIMVGIDGISKLTDFGVAKARTRLSHTATGLVKGKIHYMSPEQARTEDIDRRCDVWAGGVMVWEAVAGRRLYKERNDAAVLLQLIMDPPPRLRTIRNDIPQPLEDVVHHALATDVDNRCENAKRFAEHLLAAADALGGAASTDEVAAYVLRMSGQNLKKRREQIGEVVKLREEIHTIARESTIDTHELTASLAEGGPVSASRAANDELAPSASAPDPAEDEETLVTHSAATLVSRATERKARTLGILAGIAVIGTLAYVLARSPAPPVLPGSTVSVSVSDTEPAPSRRAGPQPSVSAERATTPETTAISIRANAPIRKLRIGNRLVEIDPPRPELTTPIAAQEHERDQPVLLTAADGRQAKATLPRGATSLNIVFVTRSPPQRWPRRPRPTVAPLATNPHQ